MTKKQEPEITTKNTKEQILAAYQQALAQLTQKDVTNNPEANKKQIDEKAIIAKAIQHTSLDIFADLGSLKSNLIKEIDTITQQLVDEFAKLNNVRKAIEIEQKYLDEVYGIKENTNALSALLLAQEQERAKFASKMAEEKLVFTTEMDNKKAEWLKHKTELELSYTEQKAQLTKDRKREEEEYQYTLKTTRLKDIDDYNFRKAKLEQELIATTASIEQREQEIAAKEDYLITMEEKVASFTEILNLTTSEAVQKIKDQLTLEHQHDLSLREQTYQSTKTLHQQKIDHLETKIVAQELLIKELDQKATSAIEQVQAIAYRALETSTQRIVVYPSTTEHKTQEKSS